MDNIYSGDQYAKQNPNWHKQDAALKADAIAKLITPYNLPLATVAEFGCGSGEVLLHLSEKLSEQVIYHGYDIAPYAIEMAKQNEAERLHFHLTDITQPGFKHHFDLSLVIDVIEHLEDYFSFLRKVKTLSTYSIFHIPLDMCMWSLFREQMLIESKARVGHIHNFTEDFIKSIFNDLGYQIVACSFTPPTFENMTTKQRAVDSVRKVLFKLNRKFCMKTLGGYSMMLLTKNNL